MVKFTFYTPDGSTKDINSFKVDNVRNKKSVKTLVKSIVKHSTVNLLLFLLSGLNK